MHLPLADPDAMRFQVHAQVSDRKGRIAGARRHPRGVAERDPHARQQLADAERLGQVIVGAGIESLDLVPLAPARGEHDDRRGRPRADAAGDLDAVQVRKAQVQEDDVRRPRRRLDEGLVSRDRLDEAIADRGKRRAQEAHDLGLVLDGEDHPAGAFPRARRLRGAGHHCLLRWPRAVPRRGAG